MVILYYIVCIYHFRQYITFENEAQIRLENNVINALQMAKAHRKPPNFYEAPHLLTTPSLSATCHAKLQTANKHFLIMHSAADYGSWFSPKMRSSFCSWVCLRSDDVLTTDKPLQGSLKRWSRYACLVQFWCTPECDCCILTCPNEPHQEGKRTLVWFDRTKWGRCDSTPKDLTYLTVCFAFRQLSS